MQASSCKAFNSSVRVFGFVPYHQLPVLIRRITVLIQFLQLPRSRVPLRFSKHICTFYNPPLILQQEKKCLYMLKPRPVVRFFPMGICTKNKLLKFKAHFYWGAVPKIQIFSQIASVLLYVLIFFIHLGSLMYSQSFNSCLSYNQFTSIYFSDFICIASQQDNLSQNLCVVNCYYRLLLAHKKQINIKNASTLRTYIYFIIKVYVAFI